MSLVCLISVGHRTTRRDAARGLLARTNTNIQHLVDFLGSGTDRPLALGRKAASTRVMLWLEKGRSRGRNRSRGWGSRHLALAFAGFRGEELLEFGVVVLIVDEGRQWEPQGVGDGDFLGDRQERKEPWPLSPGSEPKQGFCRDRKGRYIDERGHQARV
ncbi:hypothetical protein B0H10DRAFT_2184834 [Mycena sp. CBHHK59/15]|nr:hypothetical protein B0H10DRAFT_2184834 [Mycena sp. CBHHK59/15]